MKRRWGKGKKAKKKEVGTHLNEENIHFSLCRVFLVSNVSVAAVAAAATVYRLIMRIVFTPCAHRVEKIWSL